MRPFGCHVIILNTLDHLGKFDGKADEGYFVRYSMNSKDFRVYNVRTKRVEENMHIEFLENKPIVVGTKYSIGIGQSHMEIGSTQDYIFMPLWKDGSPLFDSSLKIFRDAEKKHDEVSDKESGASNDLNSTFENLNTKYLDYPMMPGLETIATNDNSEEEADFTNLESSIHVSPTPTTRTHKNHPLKIEKEVYVCQPLGFEDSDHPDKVYKVELCTEFERLMKDKFQMSSMGELTFFLGLQVKQKEDGIFISHDKYVIEKKTMVATSTTEAEYVAAASCCGQVKQSSMIGFGEMIQHNLTTGLTKLMLLGKLTTAIDVNAVEVSFLEKPTESEGFEKIIDFLNANPVKYELTVNPTIYTSCNKQFWATTKVKTINGEQQIQALVDKKKVIITETSVRSNLHLEDTGNRYSKKGQKSKPKWTKPSTEHSKQPFSLEEYPLDTMADQRTMAEFLRAPTEGYEEAIMVPPILALHFELKHSLINMTTSDQFFRVKKDNPHDHICWLNKITSTIKYKDVPNLEIKLMLFPFSLVREACRWLEKEPPRMILTWEDIVSKFINEYFSPTRTTNRRNEFYNFQQRFDESFHEAWDRYKDLLLACESCDVNSSSSSEIAKLTHAVNQQTSAVTTAITAILKQFQATPPPAFVKAIEEICVTCGGAHPYYQCLGADGNTFLEFRDNIQGYVSAARLTTIRKTKKINKVSIKAMQAQINNVKNELRNEMQTSIQVSMSKKTNELKNMMASFFQMNTASTSGSRPLPSNIIANLKDLLSNKEKLLELENTPLNENCSAVILKKLPKKLRDPRKFLIPCGFSEIKCKALANLDRMELQEMSLFRPFLWTARALIDVYGEEMILHDGDERLTLNMRYDTSSYSNQPYKESINMINIYNDSSEDYLEYLFATNHLSSNLTFSSHTDLISPEVINH
nr:hypothetical protein [Tanacetum cinerariifolium]